MSIELYNKLLSEGEYYAAELLINTDRSALYRYSKAVSAYFKNAELTAYDGGWLYPCGLNINKNHENETRINICNYLER